MSTQFANLCGLNIGVLGLLSRSLAIVQKTKDEAEDTGGGSADSETDEAAPLGCPVWGSWSDTLD